MPIAAPSKTVRNWASVNRKASSASCSRKLSLKPRCFAEGFAQECAIAPSDDLRDGDHDPDDKNCAEHEREIEITIPLRLDAPARRQARVEHPVLRAYTLALVASIARAALRCSTVAEIIGLGWEHHVVDDQVGESIPQPFASAARVLGVLPTVPAAPVD